MRKLAIVLSSLLTLVCAGGCIPIGVRGSNMPPAALAPPEIAPSIPWKALDPRAPDVSAARIAPASAAAEA